MAISIGGGSGNQIAINGTAGSPGQVIVTDGSNAYWGAPGSFGGVGDRVFGCYNDGSGNIVNAGGVVAGWTSITLICNTYNGSSGVSFQYGFGGTWQVHGYSAYASDNDGQLFWMATAIRIA
jgi:hypothetical protein